MLLSDEEQFTIILSSIRDYEEGVDDIGILIIVRVINQIISCVKDPITTQDIFDEILEVIKYYNDFIEQKNIDLKPIPDEMADLVEIYINEVVEDVQKTNEGRN